MEGNDQSFEKFNGKGKDAADELGYQSERYIEN